MRSGCTIVAGAVFVILHSLAPAHAASTWTTPDQVITSQARSAALAASVSSGRQWVDMYDFCRTIDGPAARLPIPLGSAAEWQAFRQYAPASAVQTVCCRPQTVTLCQGAAGGTVTEALPYTVLGAQQSPVATCTDQWGQPYTDSQTWTCGQTGSGVTADGLWNFVSEQENVPNPPGCPAGPFSWSGSDGSTCSAMLTEGSVGQTESVGSTAAGTAGSAQLVCQSNGTWLNQACTCVSGCDLTKTSYWSGGQVVWGSPLTYQCSQVSPATLALGQSETLSVDYSGWEAGAITLTCSSSGQLSVPNASCGRIQCLPTGNKVMWAGFVQGITYNCADEEGTPDLSANESITLVSDAPGTHGTETATCSWSDADQQWELSYSNATCSGTGPNCNAGWASWSTAGGYCASAFNAIANGNSVGVDNIVGSMTGWETLTCNNGVVTGSNAACYSATTCSQTPGVGGVASVGAAPGCAVTCQPGYNLTGAAPTQSCQLIPCSQSAGVGGVATVGAAPGCTVTCQPGYNLVGIAPGQSCVVGCTPNAQTVDTGCTGLPTRTVTVYDSCHNIQTQTTSACYYWIFNYAIVSSLNWHGGAWTWSGDSVTAYNGEQIDPLMPETIPATNGGTNCQSINMGSDPHDQPCSTPGATASFSWNDGIWDTTNCYSQPGTSPSDTNYYVCMQP